jgi:monoamine oxidase
MAGLTAARTLAEAGRSVTLLEAGNRVGGRILTLRDHQQIIELGAEFVHGKPPELWSLIEEAGLETYELDGSRLSFADGRLELRDQQEEFTPVLVKLAGLAQADLPFADYLEQQHVPADQRRGAIAYVEGFNAADHRIISALSLGLQQAAEDQIEGDRLFRIKAGYDRLPQFLADRFTAAGGRLHRNTLVKRVDWTPHHVSVEASDIASGQAQPVVFEAPQAIIALPLGVLQQHSIVFVPTPAPLHEARRLRMGHVHRFTLLFRQPFWTQLGPAALSGDPALSGDGDTSLSEDPVPLKDLSFLFSFTSMPPVWWTAHPSPGSTLTGWIGGPRSEAFAKLTAERLAEAACAELARIFSLTPTQIRDQLLRCHTHDWQRDALFSGAYSYIPAGSIDACSKMTLPADDTLYFAGEHTDTTGHWGTVHAAIRSGQRAAHQILHP